MKELEVLAAAVLIAGSATTNAQSEFDFAYKGSVDTRAFCSDSPFGTCPGFPPPSEPLIQPWTGTISFVTSSSADGMYTCRTGCSGDGQLSIVKDGTSWPSWVPGPLTPGPPMGPLTLTLRDGAIVSLGGRFTPDPTVFPGYIIDANYLLSNIHRTEGAIAFTESGVATLTLIPEPATWLLLAGGLAGITARGGRRRQPRGTHACS